MARTCRNPFCRVPLSEGKRKPGTPKRYCSVDCRLDGWALRRVVKLIAKARANGEVRDITQMLTNDGGT